MTPKNLPKKLLVEGVDDVSAISGLMGHYMNFAPYPVEHIPLGSDSKLLNKDEIHAQLKSSATEVVGIVIDADRDMRRRRDALKAILGDFYPYFPTSIGANGLVYRDEQPAVGIWIMPDNRSHGYIETFCAQAIRTCDLWNFAKETAANAKSQGAQYKDIHEVKAHIHTWLAWQDQPGERMGNAFKKNYFDSASPSAIAFAKWYIELFDLSGEVFPQRKELLGL